MNTANIMIPSVTVDLHSHCLPGIDDGAVDVRESVRMLQDSLLQGVHTVVATPHFYYGDTTVEAFLDAREQALQTLRQRIACTPELTGRMRLLLGAEVLLRRGLGQIDLRPLCMQGTDAILLELPFMSPPAWLYDEVEEIALGQRLTVILAHVDRYRHWYSSAEVAQLMTLPDLVVQLNADAFLDGHEYRRLRHWLPQPQRLMLGSDMHHADHRAPHIAAACQKMRRHYRCGRRWLALMAQSGEELLHPTAASAAEALL